MSRRPCHTCDEGAWDVRCRPCGLLLCRSCYGEHRCDAEEEPTLFDPLDDEVEAEPTDPDLPRRPGGLEGRSP